MTVEVAIEVLQARARQRVLDNLRVAAPCPADWNQMVGDDRVRHCNECKLDVYNLSDMTREEAEALIESRIGRLCVRFYQRSDGTVITADCPVGSTRRQRRRLVAATAAGGLAASALALWATSPEPTQLEREHEVLGFVMLPGSLDSRSDPPHKHFVHEPVQPTTAPASETIVPDGDTRAAMAEQHITELRGRWQVCLDDGGAVTHVTQLESSGFERFDVMVHGTLLGWHYNIGPRCFELTVGYTTPPS